MTCIAARVRRRVDGGTRRDALKRARQPAAPTSWVRDATDGPDCWGGGTERDFSTFRGIFWLALGAQKYRRESARALPAAGVPQSGAPPSATMRRSPTPLPPNLPRCESALLALPRERKGGYRADTDIAVPSPFEEMARLARRLDVLGGDDKDATTTDHSHHRRDIDDDLANAWTVARRLAEGRAELRPALTLLAQCMEQRARAVRRRMDARARCAGALLARVMEVRATADRVERALEDTGLLTPARRACGIDDASPEKTHPSSQHVHACATFDEEVRAINEGRRRPSALPAPLGITPPVTASDPNNKRARRDDDDDDDDEAERRRKQRREFSFDLVTPTLSTTPDEGDEEEDEKECDEASQPEPMPTSEDPEDPDDTAAVTHEDHEEATAIKETQDDVLGSDEDVERGDDEDRELEGEVLVTTDCQKLIADESDGEDSGYSAEAELSLSVTASLSAFAKQHGGGTQSQ